MLIFLILAMASGRKRRLRRLLNWSLLFAHVMRFELEAGLFYLGVKSFHVMAVIAWMAGLFYLPRLFVYHAGVAVGSEQSETFKVMERRLYKAIMVPAMLAAWVSGLALVYILGWSEYWIWVKLLFVLGLTGFQGLLARHMRGFATDQNIKSGRYFRWINELPTVAMIVIVTMVIIKPF